MGSRRGQGAVEPTAVLVCPAVAMYTAFSCAVMAKISFNKCDGMCLVCGGGGPLGEGAASGNTFYLSMHLSKHCSFPPPPSLYLSLSRTRHPSR